jgi:hypothetical protein
VDDSAGRVDATPPEDALALVGDGTVEPVVDGDIDVVERSWAWGQVRAPAVT